MKMKLFTLTAFNHADLAVLLTIASMHQGKIVPTKTETSFGSGFVKGKRVHVVVEIPEEFEQSFNTVLNFNNHDDGDDE